MCTSTRGKCIQPDKYLEIGSPMFVTLPIIDVNKSFNWKPSAVENLNETGVPERDRLNPRRSGGNLLANAIDRPPLHLPINI